MQLIKIILFLLLIGGNTFAQMFPAVSSSRPPEPTVESKSLGTFEQGSTYSDSLTIILNTRRITIDSVKSDGGVTADIYDSLLVYGDTLKLLFDVDISTVGSYIGYWYWYHSGYGSPDVSTVSWSVQASPTTFEAPYNLVASNNEVNGINVAWQDSNEVDTVIGWYYGFVSPSEEDDWNPTHDDADEIDVESGQLVIYNKTSMGTSYPGGDRTFPITANTTYRFTLDGEVGTANAFGLYVTNNSTTTYINYNRATDGSFTRTVVNPSADSFYVKLQAYADAEERAYINSFLIEYTESGVDSVQLWKRLYFAGSPDEPFGLLVTQTASDTDYTHVVAEGTQAEYKARFIKDGEYSDYSNVDTATFTVSTSISPDYYVSSSGGSDANDGLTEETAWASISKVNTEMSGFSAGDIIAFKRGDSFITDTTLMITKSGTAGNPIRFTAYGTGDKPIMKKNSASTYRRIFYVYNSSNIKIDNLNFQVYNAPSVTYSWNGITIYADTVEVRDCDFEGSEADVLTNSKRSTAIGIYTGTDLDSILITNNDFHDINLGITIDGTNYQCTGAIDSNYFYDVYSEAFSEAEPIRITGEGGHFDLAFRVSNNEFTGWGENALDMHGTSGVIVEYNYFHNPKDISLNNDGDYGGGAIKGGSTTSDSSIFRFNRFVDLEKTTYAGSEYGIYFEYSNGSEVYGNLFDNVEYGIRYASQATIEDNTVTHGVYYNTMVDVRSGGVEYSGSSSGFNTIYVKNNIIFSDGFTIKDYSAITNDYNMYNSVPSIGGAETNGILETDETNVFSSYATADYTLTVGAAVIDSATAIGNDVSGFSIDSLDISGNSRSNPDMGAYEKQ